MRIPTCEARISDWAREAAKRLWGQLLQWKVISPIPRQAEDDAIQYIASVIEAEATSQCAGMAQEILNGLEATADEIARGYDAGEELSSLQEGWEYRRDELVERYMQLAAELGYEDDAEN